MFELQNHARKEYRSLTIAFLSKKNVFHRKTISMKMGERC